MRMLPSLDPGAGDVARKRFLLRVTVIIFVVSAVIVLMLPVRLPRPVRLAVAGTDLIAAAIIWLLGRQRYGK